MSDQRIFLGDYFQQSPLRYHAKFDRISHHKGIPTVLLKDIYIVDKDDVPIKLTRNDLLKDNLGHKLIADHVWIDLSSNWFKLPTEIFYGDEITFEASVERYPITRDDLLNKRNEIWENTKLENENLKQSWRNNKFQYRGQLRYAKYEQLQSQIRQNIQLAKKRQKEIPMVDYGLARIEKIKIEKLQPLIEYKGIRRIGYSLDRLNKYKFKYINWISKRTEQYKLLLSSKNQL